MSGSVGQEVTQEVDLFHWLPIPSLTIFSHTDVPCCLQTNVFLLKKSLVDICLMCLTWLGRISTLNELGDTQGTVKCFGKWSHLRTVKESLSLVSCIAHTRFIDEEALRVFKNKVVKIDVLVRILFEQFHPQIHFLTSIS